MAPDSPTKASVARAMASASGGGSRVASASSKTSSRSTSTSSARSAKALGASSTTTQRSRTLASHKKQASGASAGQKDLSTATATTATSATDESYFSLLSSSLSSAPPSAASSRAPSRAATNTGSVRGGKASAGAGAGGGLAPSTMTAAGRPRSRTALSNNTNQPLPRTNSTNTTKKTGPATTSTTSSTATATASALASAPLGRVKAQAQALENAPFAQVQAQRTGGAISHQSSSGTLRSVASGLDEGARGTAATASVGGASQGRAVAKKLPPSKLSCFEVEDVEGIKAYLRIRPAPQEDKEYAEPYIQVLNETQVLMKPPREGTGHGIRARVHANSAPVKYTFTRVFAPSMQGALVSPTLGSTPKAAPGPGAGAGSTTSSTNDQASFFQHTTLPLVRNLLSGESGLIFTYGVTNSGKSYTIVGGRGKNEAGILPRALDVIFNSIRDRQLVDPRVRPKGLVGVEILPQTMPPEEMSASTLDSEASASSSTHSSTIKRVDGESGRPFIVPTARKATPTLARSGSSGTLGGASASTTITPSAASMPAYDAEPTTVSVDRNFRYSVWISYVEIYNEKLFDLLDATVGEPGSVPGAGAGAVHEGRAAGASGAMPASPSKQAAAYASGGLAATFGMSRSDGLRGSSWSIASTQSSGRGSGPSGGESSGVPSSSAQPSQTGSHITLARRPLTLKNDPDPNAGGKYVAGLSEHRVSSADEARALLQRGSENRAVFGTLANRTSSRSHGVFTIKLIREHAGAAAAATSDAEREFYTSRLCIVDLAGSERATNTGLSSGERLKEAGNINKSLMCLGQCLETIRKNQARQASLIPTPLSLADVAAAGRASGIGAVPPSPSLATLTGPQHHAPSPSKRRLSVVPFRYSKLTELFQSFFPGADGMGGGVSSSSSTMGGAAGGGGSGGAGRAVMIVNANPYDTGYDENSHVMKFSAVARDVQTLPRLGLGGGLPVSVAYGAGAGAGLPPSASTPALVGLGRGVGLGLGVGVPPIRFAPTPVSTPSAATAAGPAPAPIRTLVTPASPTKKELAAGAEGESAKGSMLAAVKTDEEQSDGVEVTIVEMSDEEDDDDSDAFVDMLMQKHEELRQMLYETEVQASLVEARVRAEMRAEMEKSMLEMEQFYQEQAKNDAAEAEALIERKLDLLAGGLHREREHERAEQAAAMEAAVHAASTASTAGKTPKVAGQGRQRRGTRAASSIAPSTPTMIRVTRSRAAAAAAAVEATVAEDASTVDDDEEDEEDEDEEADEDGDETTRHQDGGEDDDGEEDEHDSLGIIASRCEDDGEHNEGNDEEEDEGDGDSIYLPH